MARCSFSVSPQNAWSPKVSNRKIERPLSIIARPLAAIGSRAGSTFALRSLAKTRPATRSRLRPRSFVLALHR
jgi:hypothetical protein